MTSTAIGLDIGHHSVRAVALRRAGRALTITGHAAVRRRDDEGQPRPLALVLAELDALLSLKGPLHAALGEVSTLVRYVSTIPLQPDRLQRLLRLELEQQMEGSELAADTFPVPLAGEELIHCCVMSQPTQIHAALGEMKALGITPRTLSFAPVAVYNATVPVPPVTDEHLELALLVDIGATTTGLSLFGERRLLACRQLSLGGDAFTQALIEAGGFESARAEAMKCSGAIARGITAQPPLASTAASAASPADDRPLVFEEASGPAVTVADPLADLFADDALNPPVASASAMSALDVPSPADLAASSGLRVFGDESGPAVPGPGTATVSMDTLTLGPELMRVAENLYAQLASSLAWFKTQIHARNLAITKVYLVGGGAGLSGLDVYLQRRFNVPVERMDPCASFAGEQPARPWEYTAALGLAVGALSPVPGAIQLDLTPDGIQLQRLWRSELVWPWVAAASLLLAAVLAGWTMLNEQAADQASLDAYRFHSKTAEELRAQLDELEREKTGFEEDLRAIAGRIFAGRDLLYAVRALKEAPAVAGESKARELWLTRMETVGVGQDAEVRESSPAPTGTGRRMGATGAESARKSGRHDTAIDRGAIDITGLVKFDSAPTDTDLNAYFEAYKEWIAKWQPGKDAPLLFADVRVLEHVINHSKKDAVKTGRSQPRTTTTPEEAGRFPFKLRYAFQPTTLSQITDERSTPSVRGP